MQYKVLHHAKIVISTDGNNRLGIDIGRGAIFPLQEVICSSEKRVYKSSDIPIDAELWTDMDVSMYRVGDPIDPHTIDYVAIRDSEQTHIFTYDELYFYEVGGITMVLAMNGDTEELTICVNIPTEVRITEDFILPMGCFMLAPPTEYREEASVVVHYAELIPIASKWIPSSTPNIPYIHVGEALNGGETGEGTTRIIELPESLASQIITAWATGAPALFIEQSSDGGTITMIWNRISFASTGGRYGYSFNLLGGLLSIEGDKVIFRAD